MKKHEKMKRVAALRPHLLKTQWMTDSRTKRMLKNYSIVFFKPDQGSGGSGIIRVKRLKRGYQVRRGRRKKITKSRSVLKVIKSFRKRKHKHKYLVQRGVRLAKYRGKIFDIRVYMQKPKRKWEISGMAVRVAASNKFVTNYQKGGHAEPLRKVLSKFYKNKPAKVNSCYRKLKKLSKIIAKTVSKINSTRELGVDFALDRKGHIWIIEANSRPGHKLFTQLPNRKMLKTIMKNKRSIGI